MAEMNYKGEYVGYATDNSGCIFSWLRHLTLADAAVLPSLLSLHFKRYKSS